MTLTGRSFEFQATPATPSPLFVSAAAMPATQVPCELSSVASMSPLMKSRPVDTTLFWSSTWLMSKPVSRMAMTVAASPWVSSQAGTALMSAPAVIWGWMSGLMSRTPPRLRRLY